MGHMAGIVLIRVSNHKKFSISKGYMDCSYVFEGQAHNGLADRPARERQRFCHSFFSRLTKHYLSPELPPLLFCVKCTAKF
jgi:hypothetical protein